MRNTLPRTVHGALILAVGAALLATGCQLSRQESGRLIGGAAGAAAGSQVGSGSGRLIATVVGGLLGSLAGERIGARMEARDYRRAGRALEEAPAGERASWTNPNTGVRYAVTPTDTYRTEDRPCREFRFRAETERGAETREHTACRQPDGTWEIL